MNWLPNRVIELGASSDRLHGSAAGPAAMRRPDLTRTALDLLNSARLPPDEVAARFTKAIDPGYWEGLGSVRGTTSDDDLETEAWTPRDEAEIMDHLTRRGYIHARPLVSDSVVARMRACVEALRREHWPAVFTFVYDDFWKVVRTPSLRRFLAAALGPSYRQNRIMSTYYVPSSTGSTGWPPHVDSTWPSEEDSSIIREKLTIWIPLGEATVENGCIYLIPKDVLPAFVRERDSQTYTWQQVSALLQSSRALPARAGSVLGWNHRLIHWGSTSSGVGSARVSMAVEFLGAQCTPKAGDEPTFDHSALPPFSQRLRIVGHDLLDYQKFEPGYVRYADLANRLVDQGAIPST